MFIPKHFLIEDKEQAKSFILHYNFGLLLCNGDKVPFVTHLPFYIEDTDGGFQLITHLAFQNPHCKALENTGSCLVIFNGPEGYVSPSLYASPQNVPTWNYMTVHVTGIAEIIHDDAEKRKYMHLTIEHAEKEFQEQYNSLSPAYLNEMYKALAFVKIKISDIETKFKLSQNKELDDRKRVAENFGKKGKQELAAWMRKVNGI